MLLRDNLLHQFLHLLFWRKYDSPTYCFIVLSFYLFSHLPRQTVRSQNAREKKMKEYTNCQKFVLSWIDTRGSSKVSLFHNVFRNAGCEMFTQNSGLTWFDEWYYNLWQITSSIFTEVIPTSPLIQLRLLNNICGDISFGKENIKFSIGPVRVKNTDA